MNSESDQKKLWIRIESGLFDRIHFHPYSNPKIQGWSFGSCVSIPQIPLVFFLEESILPKFVGCMMHQTDLRGEKGRNPERLYLVAHLQRLMSVRPTRPLPIPSLYWCVSFHGAEAKPPPPVRGVCVIAD